MLDGKGYRNLRGTSRERGGEEGKVRGRAEDRRRRAGEWRSER